VSGSKERRISFPLRLAGSLKDRATDLAKEDGISLNHFISLALAEKVSRLEAGVLRKDSPSLKQNSDGKFSRSDGKSL
jgi:HicB family